MKSFKQYAKIHEEAPAVNTASVGVTADDVKNIGPRKKKRRPRVLTRNYIEIMGKRKRVRN